MEVKPTAFPKALEMTNHIIKTLQLEYLSKENLKSNYWMLDFIESKEGHTYFMQVKAFACKPPKAKSVPKFRSNSRRKGKYMR